MKELSLHKQPTEEYIILQKLHETIQYVDLNDLNVINIRKIYHIRNLYALHIS